jgi:hypothetical protein
MHNYEHKQAAIEHIAATLGAEAIEQTIHKLIDLLTQKHLENRITEILDDEGYDEYDAKVE